MVFINKLYLFIYYITSYKDVISNVLMKSFSSISSFDVKVILHFLFGNKINPLSLKCPEYLLSIYKYGAGTSVFKINSIHK